MANICYNKQILDIAIKIVANKRNPEPQYNGHWLIPSWEYIKSIYHWRKDLNRTIKNLHNNVRLVHLHDRERPEVIGDNEVRMLFLRLYKQEKQKK